MAELRLRYPFVSQFLGIFSFLELPAMLLEMSFAPIILIMAVLVLSETGIRWAGFLSERAAAETESPDRTKPGPSRPERSMSG